MKSTVDLTSSLKSENYDSSVLSIMIKIDKKQVNQKRNEVNSYLKELRKEMNIYFIDGSNKSKLTIFNRRLFIINIIFTTE